MFGQVRAPTVWEEGRLTAARVAQLAVLAGVMALGLDLLLNDRLTPVFDVAVVLICLAAALGVRHGDFTVVALVPPLLLLGVVGVLALLDTSYVAEPRDGWVQALVSGVTHRITGLAVGYALLLAVMVVRLRVRVRFGDRTPATAHRPQRNRSGSPAPTRITSG